MSSFHVKHLKFNLAKMIVCTVCFAVLYSFVELCLHWGKVREVFSILYEAPHYFGNIYGYHIVVVMLFTVFALASSVDVASFFANLLLGLSVEDIVGTLLYGRSICDSIVYQALNIKPQIPFIHIAVFIIVVVLYVFHVKRVVREGECGAWLD